MGCRLCFGRRGKKKNEQKGATIAKEEEAKAMPGSGLLRSLRPFVQTDFVFRSCRGGRVRVE